MLYRPKAERKNFMVLCKALPVARLWQSENWSVPHPPAQGSHRCPASHCHQTGQQLLSISLHLALPNLPVPPTPAKCHSHTLHHAQTGKGTSRYMHWDSESPRGVPTAVPPLQGWADSEEGCDLRNVGGRVSRARPGLC